MLNGALLLFLFDKNRFAMDASDANVGKIVAMLTNIDYKLTINYNLRIIFHSDEDMKCKTLHDVLSG